MNPEGRTAGTRLVRARARPQPTPAAPPPVGRRWLAWPALAVLLVIGGLVACRQDMHDAPKYEPLEASEIFADGTSARPLIPGTVARGLLREDRHLYTGMSADGELVDDLPFPVTHELVERGRERYNAFCSPCHDRVGNGRGMVVQRGFKQPNTFHSDRLRATPVGYFFDVITKGFGEMSSYAAQVEPEDRWAIAAYIRALQLSQSAPVELLSPADQAELAAAPSPDAAVAESGGE